MSNRGHSRERAFVALRRSLGFWCMRAPGSLGIDVVEASPSAVEEGLAVLSFYEIKSNVSGGPWMNFRPEERQAMLAQAEKAGAHAYLVYWPPYATPTVIPASQWPAREAA